MDIENIKDAVYELEGLLELAELREDKLPALLPLMKNKLDVINALFADANAGEKEMETETVEQAGNPDLDIDEEEGRAEEPSTEPQEEAVAEEVADVPEEIAINEEIFAEEEPDQDSPELYNTYDDEDEEVYVPLISPVGDEPEDMEVPTIPVVPESISDEKVEQPDTVTERYSEDFSSSFGAEYEIEDDEEEIATVDEASLQEEKSSSAPVFVAADPNAPKPAFCINDRFRFRRELFNNSDAVFSAAMDLVATMDGYEEAEDYFLVDRGWDIERPEVMDFMAIIRNYFEK
ncbi:MAG: hypothetical protein K2G23_07675 [Muribaculaceae bacterium]|nr:hypothetical protein [Muribaculaceae bacterium]